MLTITIVIPVYNEGKNIDRTLDSLNMQIKKMQDVTANFVVNIIYDFDEDNTLPVIKRIRENYSMPINLIKNDKRGVIFAIKNGIKTAEGDYVLITMADMSDDYEILPQLVDLARQEYDVICGSRYMKGGKLYGGPLLKQLLSRVAGISLHFLTGIPTHDITNSYKMYKKSIFNNMVLESEGGFEIGMEITAKTFINGGKITEIPSRWWDRTEGKSRFQLTKWLPKYLQWYFYVLKNNFLKTPKHE